MRVAREEGGNTYGWRAIRRRKICTTGSGDVSQISAFILTKMKDVAEAVVLSDEVKRNSRNHSD